MTAANANNNISGLLASSPDKGLFGRAPNRLRPRSGGVWKQQFTGVEHDLTVPPSNYGRFWCMYTQRCIGPDGKLAEPDVCLSASRRVTDRAARLRNQELAPASK
jgi:hypothetical protein